MGKQNSFNVWISTFQQLQEKELRKDYGHVWSLTFQYNLGDKLTPEQKKDGWKILKMNSSGSFFCSKCSSVWESSFCPFVFHYWLMKSKRGLVQLNICREQCQICKNPNMIKLTIQEDTMLEFLLTLIKEIRKNFYTEEETLTTKNTNNGAIICSSPQPTEKERKTPSNVWMSTFQNLQEKELQKNYGCVWNLNFQYDLVDKLTPEQQKDGWKILKINSFGRYVCSLCSNIWKSGLIQLLFHYRSVNSKRGLVLLLLQCPQCKSTNMEKTTLEEDKIHDFLMSLITTIRKQCYNNNIQPTTLKTPKCKAVPSLPPKEKEGEKNINVWISTFQHLQEKELRKNYNCVWNINFQYDLVDKLTPEQQKNDWKILKMNSFGRYVCSLCSNIWKSGLIQLLFHYRSVNSKRGLVLLQICREQCPQCKSTNMEKPTLEEDKIHEILMSLITAIRKKCCKNNIQPTTLKPPKSKAVPSLPPKGKGKQKSQNVWMKTFHFLQEKELGADYGNVWSLNFKYVSNGKADSLSRRVKDHGSLRRIHLAVLSAQIAPINGNLV
ncbi:uncharacterized protein LOC128656393 isoform X2 [Bombina bombina]|nr:uncharacterized protein LOC128656393 isoform X2 [Bombina bombina]